MLAVFPLSNEVLELAPIVVPAKRANYSIAQLRSLVSALGYQEYEDDIEEEWLELISEDEVCDDVNFEEYWGKQPQQSLVCQL